MAEKLNKNWEVDLARLDERLIALDKKQDEHHLSVMREIGGIKDNTAKRVEKLEREKADSCVVEALQKKVNDDIEGRVRDLEKFKAEMNGKASQGALIISYIIALIGIILSVVSMFR